MKGTVIHLDDTHRIEADSTCWTLINHVIGEINPATQKPKMSYSATYYPNLEVTLKRYLDDERRALGSENPAKILEAIDRQNELLKKLLTPALLKEIAESDNTHIVDPPAEKAERRGVTAISDPVKIKSGNGKEATVTT